MIQLDAQTRAVLNRLEIMGRENDQRVTDRNRKRLNLERPTAELLFCLLRSAGCRSVLEIGTSNGYSTLWVAHALRANQGQPLVTIERSASKCLEARANLAEAGLAEWAQVLTGDATEQCAQRSGPLAGPFDCVFFDADRVSAPSQLRLLWPRLAPHALLLADNALSHPEEIAGYLDAVESLEAFDTMIVPIGKGLHLAQRRAGREATVL